MNIDLKLLGYVALKSHFDRYLCCENLLFGHFLVFDRLEIQEWEIFELFVYIDSGYYALRTHNGKWLSCNDTQLSCQRIVNYNCLFKMEIIEKHDDFAYKVTMRNNFGFFLSANSTMPAFNNNCLDCEAFNLEVLPNYPRSVDIVNLEISNARKVVGCQTCYNHSSSAVQTESPTAIMPIYESLLSDDEWLKVGSCEE